MDQVSQDALGHALAGSVPVSPAADASASHGDLAHKIHRSVQGRTGNGIVDLRVDVLPESIRLSGRCSTFYCRQLAQQAAMAVVGRRALEDQIEVIQTEELEP